MDSLTALLQQKKELEQRIKDAQDNDLETITLSVIRGWKKNHAIMYEVPVKTKALWKRNAM